MSDYSTKNTEPLKQNMIIGIIGLGDMGKLYAKALAAAGYSVCGSDLPSEFVRLSSELSPFGIELFEDGKEISRKCDLIIYSVEAELIGKAVREYGPYTRTGAVVAGQTSVKHPEIAAFEAFLPKDVEIISLHALHGPGFEPRGQNIVMIPYRNSQTSYDGIATIFENLGCELIHMPDFHTHDKIVADTQAVTHLGFESMGTAWKEGGTYPWENDAYTGGIDNVKILTTLRIFSYKAHVYAGLAILNPYARTQVRRYAVSESELFKLMIMEREKEFRERLYKARDFVFHESRKPVLLDDEIMREFSMATNKAAYKPNSHLSLLSMVDAWTHLGVNPYDNLVCQTPPFRLRLGIAEYLFKNEDLLEESIQTALFDKSIRGDDLEFHSAVREWSAIIGYGDMEGYKAHFNQVKDFFSDRLEEGRMKSTQLIKRLI